MLRLLSNSLQALRTGALLILNISMPQPTNQKPSLPLVVHVDALDAASFCCRTGYCIAFIYNWRMALLITGAGPLIALGGILHMKLTFGQSTGADKLYGTANSAVTEAVSSIRVIQVCTHMCGAPSRCVSLCRSLFVGLLDMLSLSRWATYSVARAVPLAGRLSARCRQLGGCHLWHRQRRQAQPCVSGHVLLNIAL